MLENTGQRTD